MASTGRVVGAPAFWAQGFTGQGIDVALIDSGTGEVDGLTGAGKVVDGPDYSAEGDDASRRHLDSFGHGTHMAGIIAGRDDAPASDPEFVGIAPDARVVSLKVADATGATDLSRMVDAIGWVVAHRHSDGFNIRVLNLSFGAQAVRAPALDPLIRAVDAAWDSGIVVVVAAGNRGAGSGGLDTPGRSSLVLAVGADDPHGSSFVADDAVPSWSSSGDGTRNPDLLAPGLSVLSLRDPGSFIDSHYPAARVGTRFFRGSGPSISTAIVSGAAALVCSSAPTSRPTRSKHCS